MNIKNTVIDISKKAKNASEIISILSNKTKNSALENLISTIKNNYSKILESNKIDIDNAYKNSLSPQLINRLTFTEKSIDELIKSINAIISQPDPIGKIINEWTQPNGLIFKKITVPLGVIGVIYESRPNVTVDAACIAIKSGNCLILRGGSDSFHTSNTLVNIIAKSFEEVGLPKYAIQMIPFVDRDAVDYLIQMNDHIDVIIPRGGKGLIKKINSQSLIPVIKHLDGICHVYIDKDADLEKAKKVLFNSKMRRPEICGATETLLIDEDIKKMSLNLLKPLIESDCEIRGDKYICSLSNKFLNASNKDWATEYLDKIISVKIVNGVRGAIKHIKKYSSGHTESIITENKKTFFDFYQNIDSAIILNNASTQFADGGEFGFGAEVGISTNKLHPRGPIGLDQLTTYKYILEGKGQIRK